MRNWQANQGAEDQHPSPTRPTGPDFAPPIALATWQCARLNALYLRKFLDLAADRKIPVLWVIPPVRSWFQTAFDRAGDTARYTQFIREIVDKAPRVHVLDGRDSGFEVDAFVGDTHLASDGAVSYSDDVASAILDTLAGPTTTRWRTMPPRGVAWRDRAIEDFTVSAGGALIARDKLLRR